MSGGSDGYITWESTFVTGSKVDQTGFYTLSCDGNGGGSQPMLACSPYGFASWPKDPDADGSCQALVAWDGNEAFAFSTADVRVLKKLPGRVDGGSMQFGSDGAFCQFNPETSTWTLYIPVAFDDKGTPTKAHLFQIGKDTNGKRCITLLHSDGPAITILEGGKKSIVIKNANSDAYVEVNDDGITLNGKTTIKGGLSAMEGAAVAPVARSAELLTWAGLVTTAINAMLVKLNALPPTSAIPPLVPLSPSVASTTLSG